MTEVQISKDTPAEIIGRASEELDAEMDAHFEANLPTDESPQKSASRVFPAKETSSTFPPLS